MGFTLEDLDKAPTQFSGGFQLRINLTKCLLQQPDLLLLDEPTNYLDILSLNWMKRFLNSFPGEVLIITHDRDFMDTVTTHTMGIHRKNLRKIKGPTEKYYEQLALDEEIYEKTRANQEKKVEQMQKFVDRFGAKATKAAQAQSIAKRISKMTVMAQMDKEQLLGFRFNYSETPAKRFLDVDNLNFSFTEDDPLISKLSFDIKKEDRVAIIGKNGKGKTTLLNVLAGHLTPTSGSYKFHPSTKIGYYQQTHRKDLNPSSTVDEEISAANIHLGISEVRSICGAMMFPSDDAKKKISILSGGEQSRVLLGKILAQSNNMLLLDEPTNHLDMEAIEVITEEIDAFDGPVLIVTHSEKILKRLATKLIVFNQGSCQVFNGDYFEFLEKVGWEEQEEKKKVKKKIDRKELKRLRAEIIQKRSKDLSPLKKKMKDLEQELEKIDQELKSRNDKVMAALNDDSANVQELYKEIGEYQLQQESTFNQLEKILEDIDAKSNKYESKLESLTN